MHSSISAKPQTPLRQIYTSIMQVIKQSYLKGTISVCNCSLYLLYFNFYSTEVKSKLNKLTSIRISAGNKENHSFLENPNLVLRKEGMTMKTVTGPGNMEIHVIRH